MRECRYWIANDGTEFRSEEQCIAYEDELNFQNLNGACACFDQDMKSVDPLDDVRFIKYLRLNTPEAVAWVKEYHERIGYVTDGLSTPGIYVYNEDSYEWDNMEELIKTYQDIIKKVNGG